MCFEIFFTECQKNNTRQISSLPSVKKKTLGKEDLCRVLKKHSAKSLFAECQKKKHSTKVSLSSARKKHSANHVALGKEPVSGSERSSSSQNPAQHLRSSM